MSVQTESLRPERLPLTPEQRRENVRRLIIDSYESTWGLPEGQYVTYWCAYDADTARMLRDTESGAFGDTLDLVQRLYRDAEVVAEITAIEKGERL